MRVRSERDQDGGGFFRVVAILTLIAVGILVLGLVIIGLVGASL